KSKNKGTLFTGQAGPGESSATETDSGADEAAAIGGTPDSLLTQSGSPGSSDNSSDKTTIRDETPDTPPSETATEKPDDEPTELSRPTLVAEALPEHAPGVGRIRVTSQPSGASVWVGGEEIGVTDTGPLDVEVGPVESVLKHPGYRDYVYSGKVSEGEHTI